MDAFRSEPQRPSSFPFSAFSTETNSCPVAVLSLLCPLWQPAQKYWVHWTQNVFASSSSSQISHLISFGFTFVFPEVPAEEAVEEVVEEVEIVASTEEAKRLMGRDEAEETAVGVAITDAEVAACLPLPLPPHFSTTAGTAAETVVVGMIPKTLRHTGHLKGAWPIQNCGEGEVQ